MIDLSKYENKGPATLRKELSGSTLDELAKIENAVFSSPVDSHAWKHEISDYSSAESQERAIKRDEDSTRRAKYNNLLMVVSRLKRSAK